MPNSLDPDQARRFVGPELGSNCLQTVRQTVQTQKRLLVKSNVFEILEHLYVCILLCVIARIVLKYKIRLSFKVLIILYIVIIYYKMLVFNALFIRKCCFRIGKVQNKKKLSRDMRFPTMWWYVQPTKPQINLCIRAV